MPLAQHQARCTDEDWRPATIRQSREILKQCIAVPPPRMEGRCFLKEDCTALHCTAVLHLWFCSFENRVSEAVCLRGQGMSVDQADAGSRPGMEIY